MHSLSFLYPSVSILTSLPIFSHYPSFYSHHALPLFPLPLSLPTQHPFLSSLTILPSIPIMHSLSFLYPSLSISTSLPNLLSLSSFYSHHALPLFPLPLSLSQHPFYPHHALPLSHLLFLYPSLSFPSFPSFPVITVHKRST